MSAASVIATLPKEEQQQIVAAGEVAKAAKKVRAEKSRKTKAPEMTPPELTDDAEHGEKPDLLVELESARKDIDNLHLLVTSLNQDNLAAEVASVHGKIDQLAAKLGQHMTTVSEVIRQARHQADLLAQIRMQLGVETDSEILQALS